MGLLMNKLVVLTPPGQPEMAVSSSWFPHTTPDLLSTIFHQNLSLFAARTYQYSALIHLPFNTSLEGLSRQYEKRYSPQQAHQLHPVWHFCLVEVQQHPQDRIISK